MRVPRVTESSPFRLSNLLLLLLIPLTLGVGARFLQSATGPYWLGENLDPSYAYLLNSLNMANFHRPYNMEPHPGVSIQWVGSATLRTIHPTMAEQQLAENVLRSPERYIRIINDLFVGFYVLCLIIAGYAVFRVTGNLAAGLLLQATPFLSGTALNGLFGFRPECFFLALAILYAALAISTIKFPIEKHAWKYALAFSALYAVGMATKLNFLSLVVIPLILLPSWKWRSIFACFAGLVFIIIITPILTPDHLSRMFGFAFRSFTHTGRYGSGVPGVIDAGKFLDNAKDLIAGDVLFFVIVACSAVVLALRRRLRLDKQSARLLFAVTAAQILQFIIVAKHSHSRYLIPVIGVEGINLYLLINLLWSRITESGLISRRLAVTATFALILLVQGSAFLKLRASLIESTKQQLQAYDQLSKVYGDQTVVSYYTASSPDYALAYGTEYSGNLYAKTLDHLYPHRYFYGPWTRVFYTFAGPVQLHDISPDGRPFIMHGYSINDSDFTIFLPPDAFPPNLEMKPVFHGDTDVPNVLDGEAIYQATVIRSDRN
jgi:hypothetical protein